MSADDTSAEGPDDPEFLVGHRGADIWILMEPSDEISAGSKLVLVLMWWHSLPHQSHAKAWKTPDYISLANLSRWSGQDLCVVERCIRDLTNSGWIRWDRDGWMLAWRTPFSISEDSGFVYAIEFTNGTVKIGKTSSPKRRFLEHDRSAARFGVSAKRRWCTIRHDGYDTTEREVLRLVSCSFACLTGREYFHASGAFDLAVRTTDRLVYGVPMASTGGTP
jgi:hypothetical protein